MSDRYSELQCKHCNRKFTAKRIDSKYCGATCKQYAYENRRIHLDAITFMKDFIFRISNKKSSRWFFKMILSNIINIKLHYHEANVKNHYLDEDLAEIRKFMEEFLIFLNSTNSRDHTIRAQYQKMAQDILLKLQQIPIL